MPAYALAQVLNTAQLDAELADRIPEGKLVQLVQRGIMYSNVKHLLGDGDVQSLEELDVKLKNLDFTSLFSDPKQDNGRVKTQVGEPKRLVEPDVMAQANESEFTKVLKVERELPKGILSKVLGVDNVVIFDKNTITMIDTRDFTTRATANIDNDEITTAQVGQNIIIVGFKSGAIRLFDSKLTMVNVISYHQKPIASIEISSSSDLTGATVSSGDLGGDIIVWSVNTLQVVHQVTPANTTTNAAPVFKYTSKDKLLYAQQNNLHLLDLSTNVVTNFTQVHGAPVTHLETGDDKLISVDSQNELKVWQRGKEWPVSTILLGSYVMGLYPKDSQIIIVGIDGTIKTLNLKSLRITHVKTITDGSGIILSAALNGIVAVWNNNSQVIIFNNDDKVGMVDMENVNDLLCLLSGDVLVSTNQGSFVVKF